MPTTIHLPNGICLLIEALPHTPSVSIGCYIGVGSRYEPADLSGVSHLIEHMCFKGTRHYPTPRKLVLPIEGVGGYLNAMTTYESTSYYAKVPADHFERALHVIGDMVGAPLFDAHELEKERRVIIEEIRGYVDSPSEWVHTLIQQALLGDQPLGRDIAGTVETVGAIDHTTMEAFWREHYQPARMVISVAGCIPAERVIAAVEERFKQCPVQPARPPEPARPIEPGPRLTLHYRDTEQGNFCIGLPGMADNDPDRRAFAVLDTVLGGDMASRLFQEIREERGLAYNVGSDRQLFSDTGIWVIYGSVQRTLLRDSIRAALTILGQLLHEGITLDELDYVKEQVKGGLLLSQDDSLSTALRNGAQQLYYGRVLTLDQIVAEYEAVTCADVQRVAQRLIRPEQLHLAVIGPYRKRETAALQTLIEEWQP